MFSLPEIIDLAVRIEQNGAKVYREAGDSVADASLASMLLRLKEEEEDHEKWFTSLKTGLEKSEGDPRMEEMGQAVLQGVLGDQAFSLEEIDFSKIKEVKGLLKLSLEFEKDTILFYQMLGTFLEDEKTLDQLKRIIAEENRHVQALEGFLLEAQERKEL
jgi:rubrerythrin